jgi:hypothetical protein
MTNPDTVRTIEDLLCWQCTDPRGADLRHALALRHVDCIGQAFAGRDDRVIGNETRT